MNVLILGGTGVISREIVRQGLEKGFEITTFNRGSRPDSYQDRIRVIHGDRRDAADFAEKMKDIRVDTVIDMICFNAADARQTIEVFRDKAKQIIFTSSIAAYDRPYHSYPIREEAELLRTSPDFAYGFQKAEAERYLQTQIGQPGAAITIIRPSLTFGDGTPNLGILRQNRNLVRRIREGKPVVMVGEGVIPWSFTFAKDLASAYLLSCGNEKTYNDCFHITNTEIVMWEDLYRAIGKAVGREPVMYYISSHLLREFYPSVCEHLNFEKVHFSVFSNEKFQKAAPEYQPRVSLEEGIRDLIAWWEASGFPYDEQKELLEDRICACYEQFRANLLSLKP